MQKYILFVFDPKRPVGGWHAFKKDFDDLKDAQKEAGKHKFHQIVNLEEGTIIEEQE